MIIKAGSITNLTDARFFAAVDIDYIGFCFDPLSPDYISPQTALAIKGWIHGPQIVAEFANQDIENVLNITGYLQPDIIELTDEYFDGEKIKFENALPVIRKTLLNKISGLENNYLFVLVDDFTGINFPITELPLMFDVSFIDHDLVNEGFMAIQLKVSSELEVGIKNFDDVIELLERFTAI